MNVRRLLVASGVLVGAGCLPGAITHYQATLEPVAVCAIVSGQHQCDPPGDGGIRIQTTISVDERGDQTRVLMNQEVYHGAEESGRLRVDDVRDQVREASGCRTRTTFHLDALHDDPGFGLRQQLTGVVEEGNTTEGDPQQCGRNVPYGEIRRYQLTATEISQP